MTLFDREHDALIAQFEKDFSYLDLEQEEHSEWPGGHIYKNGQSNVLFLAYREGYALGLLEGRSGY